MVADRAYIGGHWLCSSGYSNALGPSRLGPVCRRLFCALRQPSTFVCLASERKWAELLVVGAIALLAGYATWLIARAAIGVWRGRQTLLTMLRLSRRFGHTDRLRVVDVDQPMAFACGIGSGHVLLSQSLLDQLSPTQLQVVLAHEQAHLEHRDAFWRLMAGMLSGIQLPGTRRRLLRDYELALEQRCDFIAAASVGCQITVAETLVAVKKIYRHHALAGMPLSMAFLSDFVPERVQALLSPGRRSNSYLGLFWALPWWRFAACPQGGCTT